MSNSMTINGVEYPYQRGWGNHWQLITPVGQYRVSTDVFVTESKKIYHTAKPDSDGTMIASALLFTPKETREWFIKEVGDHITRKETINV